MKNTKNNVDETLEIIACEIFTILGESSQGKQIYANGIMDIRVELIITFNRELTQSESIYYQDTHCSEFGEWDYFNEKFIPVGSDSEFSTEFQRYHFMEFPGLYLGLATNADKTEDILHQYTVEEHIFMKKERADILECIKNNNNYYEAYGNKLKINQVMKSGNVRAGVGTLGKNMSFKIIMEDGREIFTYKKDEVYYSTLSLLCQHQPKIAINGNGIEIISPAKSIDIIVNPDVNKVDASVLVASINGLYYEEFGAQLVPFALYTSSTFLIDSQQDEDRFSSFMGLHPEVNVFDKNYRPTALNNAYLYSAQSIVDPSRTISGKKSFTARNPFQITHDIKNGYWGFGVRSNEVDIVTLNQLSTDRAHVIEKDYQLQTNMVPGFIPQDTYSANLFVSFICVSDNDRNPDNYFPKPSQSEDPEYYNNDGALNYYVDISIIVMDRYGNRHQLILKDSITYVKDLNLSSPNLMVVKI